jgi:long-chain acyl-CoA synthetase
MATMLTAREESDALTAARAATTLPAAFQATVERFGERVALRAFETGDAITFEAYGRRVASIAAGMAGLGVGRGDRVGLLLLNRTEFFLVDTALVHLGATTFSVYATSSVEQLEYVLGHAGVDVLVTEPAFLERVRALQAPPRHVVLVEGEAPGAVALDAVERAPAAGFDFEASWRAVEPDDVLTLIYTSGTTGPPKGVELTHENVLAQWRGVAEVLPIRMAGRGISYLPPAHIADRSGSHYAQMLFGTEITTVADPRQVASVLPIVRPTSWGAVPRVAEKLKAAVEAQLGADPDETRRQRVEEAIATGVERTRLEVAGEPVPPDLQARHAAAEGAVLRPLRERLGLDAAEWVMFGAAPLPLDVHEFIRGLGVPTVEVYGMSESAMIATIYAPQEARLGTVGRPIPGVELRLADDGEVLLRGATVMRGYRNDPERTAEAIDPEGWLHTGDVGALDDDGCLRIVDRKKELIINAAGKNMSPALIEGHLKSASPLVGQAMVVGDGRPYNVALLVLEPEAGADPEDPEVVAAIGDAVAAANDRLSRVEQVKRWRLLGDEWLPGGDELTPTMKLKRRPIAEKYAAVIEELYA